MSFVEWNTALLRHFFGPELRDCNVIVSVGPDEIDDIAPELGGYAGLLQAVHIGPPWLSRWTPDGAPNNAHYHNFGAPTLAYQRKLFQPDGYVEPSGLVPWGNGQSGFPTYLPIIAALVALYSQNEDGAGFYARAIDKFQLPQTWTNGAALNEIRVSLFDDLVLWSCDETVGAYGRFFAQELGGNAFLKWLRGQSILRRTDEPRLLDLFFTLDLDPDDPLDAAQQDLLLREIQNTNPPFSVGLRLAAGAPAFRNVLLSRLDALRENWDGGFAGQTEGQLPRGGNNGRAAEASLVLFFQDVQPTWRLGLLLPYDVVANDEDATGKVQAPRLNWGGRVTDDNDSGGVVAAPSPPVHGSLEALERLRGAPNGRATITGCRGPTYLQHHGVRYLVPERERLLERDCLPDHNGHAYMLVSPEVADGFKQALVVNNAERLVELLPALQQSLPTTDWQLYHAPNAHALRALNIPFPDGRDHHRPIRQVQLAGGSAVTRGGQRWYLPYDIPMLHVESEGEVKVECDSCDVAIDPLAIPNGNHAASLGVSAIHRFGIASVVHNGGTYTLTARGLEENVLGRVRLRIAPWGFAPNTEARFGLLSDGRTATQGERICGFVIRDKQNPAVHDEIDSLPCNDSLGAVITDSTTFIQNVRVNPLLQFLDWLALRDAAFIPFGQARQRLLKAAQDADVHLSTSVIFRALRRRGLLEIVTDPHGRWSGIARLPYAVTRTYLMADGTPLSAPSGTISFNDWKQLVEHAGATYCITPFDDLNIPVIRRAFNPALPYAALTSPADVAWFSLSINELISKWQSIGYEHDPADEDEWLFGVDATWKARGNLLADAMKPYDAPWTLWRNNDPWRGNASIRVLRQRLHENYLSRPIIDERWGTWVALKSFSGLPIFANLGTWPLQYCTTRSSLWLPARLNLPLVLERALIACSGLPPSEIGLVRFRNNGNQLYGRDARGVSFGPFEDVYEYYLGREPEARTWLEYRHVPRSAAAIIARKLSCKLVDF